MIIAKQTGRAMSMPSGILIGTITALLTGIIGICITAKLIDLEIIPYQQIGYGVLITLIISSWIGSKSSIKQVKRQKNIVALLTGMCYYGLLLFIVAIFFGGQYNGVGETGLLILCGNILSILLKSSGKKRGNRILKKYGNR